MKRFLILVLFGIMLAGGATAQKRGWMLSLDYEHSVHKDMYYSNAFRLGGAYNLPILTTGLFVRPQVSINERWGDTGSDVLSMGMPGAPVPDNSYNSTGAGLAVKAGYRIWKYLEVFTGPAVEWYFYNSDSSFKNDETYAFWEIGVAVPISKFDIQASYRQHLNKPNRWLESNRLSIGVSYHF